MSVLNYGKHVCHLSYHTWSLLLSPFCHPSITCPSSFNLFAYHHSLCFSHVFKRLYGYIITGNILVTILLSHSISFPITIVYHPSITGFITLGSFFQLSSFVLLQVKHLHWHLTTARLLATFCYHPYFVIFVNIRPTPFPFVFLAPLRWKIHGCTSLR